MTDQQSIGWVPYHLSMSDSEDTLHILSLPGSGRSNAPCVAWIHGGGAAVGDNLNHYDWISHDFKAMGATVISIPYPLAPGPSPTDQVKFCVAAYRTLQDHASELGIDPDNIIVGGASYGANVALSVATEVAPRATFCLYGVHDLADKYFSDPKSAFPAGEFGNLSGDNSKESIQAEVQARQSAASAGQPTKRVMYAPSAVPEDLTWTMSALGREDPEQVAAEAVMQRDMFQHYLSDRRWMELLVPKPEGMSDEKHNSELSSQSSLSAIGVKYSVPTLFVHGKGDTLVPWSQSERAYEKLKAMDVETEILYDDKGGHLFDKPWPVSYNWDSSVSSTHLRYLLTTSLAQ